MQDMRDFMDTSLIERPFDQYQRYKDLEEIAGMLRGNEPLKILDVGGYPGLIRDFITKDEATVVDVIEDEKIENYIKADGSNLPFEDNSFDFVCSVDTFEHVDPAKREEFLKETCRVSKDYIVLICPFDDAIVNLAEQIAFDYYKATFKKDWDVLGEHLDNGLPDLAKTEEFFKKNGIKTTTIESGYIFNWLIMQIASIHTISLPHSGKLNQMVNSLYNTTLYENDHKTPAYRKIIVASKAGNLLEDISTHFSSKDQAVKTSNSIETLSSLLAMLDLHHKNNVTNELVNEIKKAHEMLKDKDVHIKNLENIIEDQRNQIRSHEEWAQKIQGSKPYKVYSSMKKIKKKD